MGRPLLQIPGRLSVADYERLLRDFRRARSGRRELENEAGRNGSKLVALLQRHGAYWWAFYDIPFAAVLACLCFALGWEERIKEIAKEDNPTRAFLEFAARDEASEHDPFEELDEVEQACFVNLYLSVCGSMEAICYFGVPMDVLMAEVRGGSSEALLRAVSIDRCALATRSAVQMLAGRQLARDKRFFSGMFKRIRSPHAGRRQYAELRYFHKVLRDVGAFDGATTEDLLSLVGDTLRLYPTSGEDPVKGLRTLFAAWQKESTR